MNKPKISVMDNLSWEISPLMAILTKFGDMAALTISGISLGIDPMPGDPVELVVCRLNLQKVEVTEAAPPRRDSDSFGIKMAKMAGLLSGKESLPGKFVHFLLFFFFLNQNPHRMANRTVKPFFFKDGFMNIVGENLSDTLRPFCFPPPLHIWGTASMHEEESNHNCQKKGFFLHFKDKSHSSRQNLPEYLF
jgi:hypothetical protein